MRNPALMGAFAIVALFLCMGQNCSTVSAVTPSGIPSSIPEGVYSGQISTTARLLINGSQQSTQTSTDNQTQAFGDSGEPLNSQSSPLYVGYKETKALSNMNVTLTVTSIQATTGGVIINYSAVLSLTTGSSTVNMNGTGQATFTQVSGGSCDYTLALALSNTSVVGSTVALQIDSAGTLFR